MLSNFVAWSSSSSVVFTIEAPRKQNRALNLGSIVQHLSKWLEDMSNFKMEHGQNFCHQEKSTHENNTILEPQENVEEEDGLAEIAAKKNRERFAINKSYSIEVGIFSTYKY